MTKSKINDLDYCYAVWQILIGLEENSFERNERIRAFQVKIRSKETSFFCSIALVPIVVLWLRLIRLEIISYNENASFVNLSTRLFGLLIISTFLYLCCFLAIKFLSKHFPISLFKLKLEKASRRQLIADLKQIDLENTALLNELNAEQPRLPDNFLAAELLEILIRYFETEQALTINEAIYSLKQELNNTGYHSKLLPQETLPEKVSSYLTQQKQLFEQIERGEI
ncbi:MULTISPECIES: hypothetical protein [unclassified Enterococcus]|uniref:hypothetical protein n=1 Tax=unclassified Enterococcus TaxID=2608891 RepID=UPI001554EB1B|nr:MULTISPECIES: hypothetical protein [unclassified Enterococcus]MBS7576624.1 hypothetical protein [Enterococcus sp. MMGLQ5-2]MBS7583889.1 hypothetical protein [Enterococcus sp. MMGLQ5-1]NPD11750.1 hypothetical protein [Enterococcus sp. MMGLQ5-1]NPD36461.1 hypothetical protein [Enterococcus sp. MMGLQ5-2]